jgi:hypothetical protein
MDGHATATAAVVAAAAAAEAAAEKNHSTFEIQFNSIQ